MVKLRHEKGAKFLHNYKFAKKTKKNVREENIWINPDLTTTEREAAFEKKKKEKKRD